MSGSFNHGHAGYLGIGPVYALLATSLLVQYQALTCIAQQCTRTLSAILRFTRQNGFAPMGVFGISCLSTVLYHNVVSLLLFFCVASSMVSTLRHDCSLRRRLILMDFISHHSISIHRVLHQDTNARATLLSPFTFLILIRFLSGTQVADLVCIQSLRVQHSREESCTGYFGQISINSVSG
jgi:hypothetical protein